MTVPKSWIGVFMVSYENSYLSVRDSVCLCSYKQEPLCLRLHGNQGVGCVLHYRCCYHLFPCVISKSDSVANTYGFIISQPKLNECWNCEQNKCLLLVHKWPHTGKQLISNYLHRSLCRCAISQLKLVHNLIIIRSRGESPCPALCWKRFRVRLAHQNDLRAL
jgi:hypothetical protein